MDVRVACILQREPAPHCLTKGKARAKDLSDHLCQELMRLMAFKEAAMKEDRLFIGGLTWWCVFKDIVSKPVLASLKGQPCPSMTGEYCVFWMHRPCSR